MKLKTQLLLVAKGFAAAKKLSLARVATIVRNDGKFFKGLEAGTGCTLETFETSMQWFSDNWPDNRVWPAKVDRPKRRKNLKNKGDIK